jgi:hypothetical protein
MKQRDDESQLAKKATQSQLIFVLQMNDMKSQISKLQG